MESLLSQSRLKPVSCVAADRHWVRPQLAEARQYWAGHINCSCSQPSWTSLVAQRPPSRSFPTERQQLPGCRHMSQHFSCQSPCFERPRCAQIQERGGHWPVPTSLWQTPCRSNLGRKTVSTTSHMVHAFLVGRACQSSWWPEHL